MPKKSLSKSKVVLSKKVKQLAFKVKLKKPYKYKGGLIDLGKPEIKNLWMSKIDIDNPFNKIEPLTVQDILRTIEPSKVHYKKMGYYVYKQNMQELEFLLQRKCLFSIDLFYNDLVDRYFSTAPVAAIVDTSNLVKQRFANYKQILLIDADERDNQLDSQGRIFSVSSLSEFAQKTKTNSGLPMVSFSCVARLLVESNNIESKNLNQVLVKAFNSNRLTILDFLPETTISLTKKEIEMLSEYLNDYRDLKPEQRKLNYGLKPPELGLNVIYRNSTYVWHKTGSTLFYDNLMNRHLLFGQDEGTYFGCQLPKMKCSDCQTLDQAYYFLKPEEVRELKTVIRQGEWFAIPVKKQDLPKIEECTLLALYGCNMTCDSIHLPVMSRDDNRHTIVCDEMRVSPSGAYFEDPNVHHDQHETLKLKGWFRFARNTAVRSVSQEGVD